MNTKPQAIKLANDTLKKMKGKGWKKRIWENLGWHAALENGYIVLYIYPNHSNEPSYHCLIDDKLPPLGGQIEWSHNFNDLNDPNDTVRAAIQAVKNRTEKVLNVFTFCCDYLDTEKKDNDGKLDNWTQQLLEPINKKKQFIGGKQITRKEALKGLGNPKDWEKFSDKMYKEIKKKPRIKK